MKNKFLLLPVLLAGLLTSCGPGKDDDKDKDPTPVESVSFAYEEIQMEVGDTKTLSYTVLPENATDKSVKWSTDDSEIVSINNGVLKAESEGSTTIYVTTNDGNKEASCYVTVSEPIVPPEPDPVETKTASLSAVKYNNNTEQDPLLPVTIEDINFSFEKNDADLTPAYFTGKGGWFRLRSKNTMTITAKKGSIKSIEFTYNSEKNSVNTPLSSDVGTLNSDYTSWTGNSKTVVFTAGAEPLGSKAFSLIKVTYEISTHHDPVDLGVKTIKEVKDYIKQAVNDEVFDVNTYGMGVDKYTTVTIKGLAMAKLHLSKTAADHGYNITEPNKVLIGDDTDTIAVASKTGDGTLYKKVGKNQMESDSKYSVTGYISMNLGVPELICTSYTWDKNQTETANISKINKGEITLSQFYEKANAINYNISGYGYDEVYTIKGLTCYYSETGGSGKTWYNFTDGTNNIRVNAYNIGGATVGLSYDVTGIISMEKYSPIIIGFQFARSQEEVVDLNEFYKSAPEMSIENLKKINYVNDTDNKYPNVINNYSKIYKTTGYITTVEEGYKYYLSISDSYIDSKDFPNGKGAVSTKYNLALIKNNNFWNLDDPYFKFNPYLDVTDADTQVTVYYTVRQTAFASGKMYWEILLIPQSIPTK